MGITERERGWRQSSLRQYAAEGGERQEMFFVLRPPIAPLPGRPSNPPHAMEEEGKVSKNGSTEKGALGDGGTILFFQARA